MPSLPKKTIFITGAGGFIGANLVRFLLKKRYKIYVLSRKSSLNWRLKDINKQVVVHRGDITNKISLQRILKKVKPNYIIHLAAYGAYSYQTNLERMVEVNIEGVKNLLEASKDIAYECFINTGSSSEYGFKKSAMKETDFCQPMSFYAVTKLAATHMCEVFGKTYNKPIVSARVFSAYGPFEEKTRFVPTVLQSILRQKTIQLTSGKQRRDFIYIQDICEAYARMLLLGKKLQGKIINIGTGKEFTNDEVVYSAFKVTKKETKIEKGAYPKRMWDTSHWKANTILAKKLLHWEPRYNLGTGIKATYLWLRKNSNYYE